jgi:hypothetical protein
MTTTRPRPLGRTRPQSEIADVLESLTGMLWAGRKTDQDRDEDFCQTDYARGALANYDRVIGGAYDRGYEEGDFAWTYLSGAVAALRWVYGWGDADALVNLETGLMAADGLLDT